MKNLLYSLIIILFTSLSCSDFLTEVPPHFISKENFFNNEQDMRNALDACYEGLNSGNSFSVYGRWWPSIDIGTDDVSSRNGRNQMLALMNHSMSGAHNLVNAWEQYSAYFVSISRANNVIDNMPKLESVDQSTKDQLLGEARAIRAFSYFNLARCYGDLPKVINEISTKQDFNLPRSSVDEIYNEIIIPDLIFASQNAPDGLHVGRLTKWSAKVILADVYITRAGTRRSSTGEFVQGDPSFWEKAREVSKDILDNSPHKLITEPLVNGQNVVPACGVAWNERSPFSVESMFELAGVNQEGFGSWLTRESFPNPNGVGFWGANPNVKPLVDQGINQTINQLKFPRTVGVGFYVPTPDLYQSFEPGDERREWGLMTQYTDDGGNVYLCQPVFRKYQDMDFLLGKDGTNFQNTNNNFVLYRYADALLIHAEAENEVNGPTTAAYTAINQIRNRAGLEDLEPGLSKESFRTAVWKERRAEFHGECKRKFDLVRTNRLSLETQNIQTNYSPEDNGNLGIEFTNLHADYGQFNFPDHEWLWPIPTEEVSLNADQGWYQNAGY